MIPAHLLQPFASVLHQLEQLDGVVVAFSGGTSSSLLLDVALAARGAGVLALTGRSPVLPSGTVEGAHAVATLLGARHEVVDVDVLSDDDFASNEAGRCRRCRTLLFERMATVAAEAGSRWLLDASPADAPNGMRPLVPRGLEIREPLRDAGLTKAQVRTLAEALDLPTLPTPAVPCLAAEVPRGVRITQERLDRLRLRPPPAPGLAPGVASGGRCLGDAWLPHSL